MASTCVGKMVLALQAGCCPPRSLTLPRRFCPCCAASKVLDPILSRCLAVRVAAPTCDEICTVLQHVAKKEHVTLPPALALRIAQESGRNLRRAVLMMETCKVQQ